VGTAVVAALCTLHAANLDISFCAKLGAAWCEHLARVMHLAHSTFTRVTLGHLVTTFVSVMFVAFEAMAMQLVGNIFMDIPTGASKC